VAVVYSLFWVPVMTDAIRTEPWALVSLHGGAKASEALLKTPTFWVFEAFQSVWRRDRRPGGIRWAVFLAIIASMVGSLAINPLSAGFLSVQDETFAQTQNFVSLAKPAKAPVSDVNDSTYLGSVAHLVYNLTTSAWLTDKYAVMPFWPSSFPSVLNGASLPISPQNWTASTSVFSLEMSCESGSGTLKNVETATGSHTPAYSVQSNDGCSFGEQLDPITASSLKSTGFATWGTFNVGTFEFFSTWLIIL
jgi:hypothetical protein